MIRNSACRPDTKSNSPKQCASNVKKARFQAGLFQLRERALLDLARAFLAIALAGECFLCAALFTGLQIERVPLDFLNDVFLLNLALKTAQSTFERFAILQMDFRQTNSPPSGGARLSNGHDSP